MSGFDIGKLDRFRRATALDRWFKPREGFHLERHLRESIGIFGGSKTQNFRIRISALAARWVEEDPWHAEQVITKRKDGSVVLSVKAAHEFGDYSACACLGCRSRATVSRILPAHADADGTSVERDVFVSLGALRLLHGPRSVACAAPSRGVHFLPIAVIIKVCCNVAGKLANLVDLGLR